MDLFKVGSFIKVNAAMMLPFDGTPPHPDLRSFQRTLREIYLVCGFKMYSKWYNKIYFEITLLDTKSRPLILTSSYSFSLFLFSSRTLIDCIIMLSPELPGVNK